MSQRKHASLRNWILILITGWLAFTKRNKWAGSVGFFKHQSTLNDKSCIIANRGTSSFNIWHTPLIESVTGHDFISALWQKNKIPFGVPERGKTASRIDAFWVNLKCSSLMEFMLSQEAYAVFICTVLVIPSPLQARSVLLVFTMTFCYNTEKLSGPFFSFFFLITISRRERKVT